MQMCDAEIVLLRDWFSDVASVLVPRGDDLQHAHASLVLTRLRASPRPITDQPKFLDMFHEGTLQSGIALAIQQQKLVACFVRGDCDILSECGDGVDRCVDESATSRQWEEEWLTSGWVCACTRGAL